MSLQEALGGHRNSLGLLRLVFAAAVIFDHAFPLGGWGTAPFLGYTDNQQSLGGLAVVGFFAISGYLIAKSGVSADVVQFMWRRFLRIFPGYWLVLLVGAFLVGPAIWVAEGNALGDYLTLGPGGPIAYLYSNWTLAIGQ
jgi:peptidoglycan/LPS O-acetylase OafA/YrhL